jgi:hypothetical protein
MTPLRLVLACAVGSAAAGFGDQDPRGLTRKVIGSLVVRENRLAISNSWSLSGCELHGSSLRARLPYLHTQRDAPVIGDTILLPRST